MKTKSGFIVPLLIIIIVALAVGGGVYFYERNKTMEVRDENENLTTENKIISGTQSNTSNWKTYTNVQYSFSFKYPSNLSPTEMHEDDIYSLRLLLNNAQDWINFRVKSYKACSNMDTENGPNGVKIYSGQSAVSNGINFHVANSEEGAAGTAYHTLFYYTTHKNYCYDWEVVTTSPLAEHSSNFDGHIDEAISTFKNIVSTFKFTN